MLEWRQDSLRSINSHTTKLVVLFVFSVAAALMFYLYDESHWLDGKQAFMHFDWFIAIQMHSDGDAEDQRTYLAFNLSRLRGLSGKEEKQRWLIRLYERRDSTDPELKNININRSKISIVNGSSLTLHLSCSSAWA